MIQRFFHPVGQGAFYSERHIDDNINIVYDCGTEYKNRGNKGTKGVVSQSFSKNDVIHYLFISHFDYDHISKISLLKKTVKKIENVVLPLLHEETKLFLSKIYLALEEDDLATLVSDPTQYFDPETQIIAVKPGESNEERLNKEDESGKGRKNNKVNIIRNGKILSLGAKEYDWVFIPHNYEYKIRSKAFVEKIQDSVVDLQKLKNDPEYATQKRIIDKLKRIYKDFDENINLNSMFLYSGPEKETNNEIYQVYQRRIIDEFYSKLMCYNLMLPKRPACLYTGDGDLNVVDVQSVYKDYWHFIGTIQIPHHGSLSSFNEKILFNRPFFCPISVGKNNSYGHPSQEVISRLLQYESYPILVTEDVDSTFVEIIRPWYYRF
jgi:hypothetical protein